MHTIFPQISNALIEKIENAKCVAVIAHKRPDGDALSSSQSMAYILSKLGKRVEILNDGPFTKKELDFLTEGIREKASEELKSSNPLVIILDSSTPDRPGEAYKDLEGCETIVIDHHASGDLFVPEELSYIVPYSPSTTMLVDQARERLGVKLDKTLATYLYVGLMTDTGFFHFLNEKQAAYAFYRASEYAKTGINPYMLYDMLNDGKSIEELKTLANIIDNTLFLFDGKLAIATQKEDQAIENISDLLYPQLLSIRGVKVVIFIKPREDEFVLGFRAKRDANIDVGSIAASLGGGGHKLAAGATISHDKNTILDFVISLFKDKI